MSLADGYVLATALSVKGRPPRSAYHASDAFAADVKSLTFNVLSHDAFANHPDLARPRSTVRQVGLINGSLDLRWIELF